MTGTSTRRRLFGSALLSVLAGLAVSSGCATASKGDYTFSDEPTSGKGGSAGRGGGGAAGKGSGGKGGSAGGVQGGQGGEAADGGQGGEVPVGGEGGMSGTGGSTGGKGGKGGTSGAGGSMGGTAGSAGGPTSTVSACLACGGAVGCEDDHRCLTVPGGSERTCVPECNGSSCPNGFTCTDGLCLPDTMGACCIDEDGDGYGSGLTCMGADCDDDESAVAPGMPELCNGVDDDCDDATDDGIDEPGYRDRCDAGDADLCPDGYMVCDGNDLVCDDPQDALVEVCNGDDDNCDGNIDEGLALATCGLGPCLATGTTCDPSSCTPGTSRPEVCNTIDDDCDGDGPDEDDATTMCTRQYTGATGTGSWACSSSGTCSITACAANRADVNSVIDDGCECALDTHSSSCGSAGTLSVPRAGSNIVVSGQLLSAGESDWFLVTFASPGAVGTAWAPTATLAAPAGILMDVLPSNCATTPPSGICSANGFAAAATGWGRNYNAYPATGPYSDLVPRDSGTFRVRVYMATVPAGAATCANRTYSLTFTNP